MLTRRIKCNWLSISGGGKLSLTPLPFFSLTTPWWKFIPKIISPIESNFSKRKRRDKRLLQFSSTGETALLVSILVGPRSNDLDNLVSLCSFPSPHPLPREKSDGIVDSEGGGRRRRNGIKKHGPWRTSDLHERGEIRATTGTGVLNRVPPPPEAKWESVSNYERCRRIVL